MNAIYQLRDFMNNTKIIEALKAENKKLKTKNADLAKRKKYGLVWEDKPEDIADKCEKELPVLIEDKNREIISDSEKPTHLIFEGDNYHSLYTLNFTHQKKIDVIYIDPPYNTGKNDFKYNDKFIDEEDRFKHSKWLSFMSKRLRLAKKLLSDDGVIFISIDDNEQANLKLLCDKIFGSNNSLINTIWAKGNAQNDAKGVQKNHEYILGYFKNNCNLKEEVHQTKTVKKDEKGCFYLGSEITTGGVGGILNNRSNLGYSIYFNGKDFIAIDDYDKDLAKTSNIESEVYKDRLDLVKDGYRIIRPPKKNDKLGCWTWSKNKLNESTGNICINENGRVNKKIYIDKNLVKNNKAQITKFAPPKSIINISSSSGSKTLNKLFGSKMFENPKPIELINSFLNLKNQNIVVLDFFAGSGSTAHAVLDLNKQDGGNRQFIVCTNNEVGQKKEKEFCKKYNITVEELKNWKDENRVEWANWCEKNGICSTVTYPRIKNVINGYANTDGIPANVKYFKTDFVHAVLTDNDKRILVEKSTELICIAENTFNVVRQKRILDYAIFSKFDQYTAIIYDENYIDKCCNELNKIKPEHETIIYVFSYDHSYNEEDFAKLNIDFIVKPIPEAIINVYRKISKLKNK